MEGRKEIYENVPLESSAVVDIVADGKIVEGTKTSVITNTLIEFTTESLSPTSHEDFFVNSKDHFGPFQGYANVLPQSKSEWANRRSQFHRSGARETVLSSDGDSTPTSEPKQKLRTKSTVPSKIEDGFESVESIDLSRDNSPNSSNSLDGMFRGENASSKNRGKSNDGIADDRSSSVCRRTDSVVEELLSDIYDGRWQSSIESDFDVAGNAASAFDAIRVKRYSQAELMSKDKSELKSIIKELQHRVQQTNSRLLRQLKNRAKKRALIQTNCDVVTACLQAKSLKREVDAKMKFALDLQSGPENFDQWCDAIRAANRMSGGVPNCIRKRVWLNLADNYLREISVDWKELKRSAFNDRSNPDDNELGIQIVKDLHRTGCSTFSGLDNDQERAVLKRVLLAYARWNKEIGYCQGFNIIAALILDVMGRKEEEALKIMIFLVDKVLPASYFSNNLRALSVDMAVFRELLNMYLPNLSKHLQDLQVKAQQELGSGGYEPPLTNVFTMQWFLTLFATCLPLHAVLRIWDAIMMEGSEIIIRTALALWGVLQKKLMKSVNSADDFYTEMGRLLQDVLDQRSNLIDVDDLLGRVYSLAPFPFPRLEETREKYTYNITPIALNETDTAPNRKSVFDNDNADTEIMSAVTRVVDAGKRGSMDIEEIGPGVFGASSETVPGDCPPGVSSEGGIAMAERTCTDVSKLQKKYEIIKRRQSQTKIKLQNARNDESFHKQRVRSKVTNLVIPPAPNLLRRRSFEIPSSNAVNHLYVKPDDERRRKNRHVVPYGTTLFADEAGRKDSSSPVRYAGAYFVSSTDETKSSAASKNDAANSIVTKVTYSDSDDEPSPAKTDCDKSDANNNDISKTLLQLHIEWKDKQSNGEESSDSSLSITSLNVPKNPLSTPTQPVGISSFTTDDIKRSENKPESVTISQPAKAASSSPDTGKPEDEKESVKPKTIFCPPHMKKEKREFGIKLGIYKPSDFKSSKPIPIRPISSSSNGKSPRITRQQINNCLARESLAFTSWDDRYPEK